jgi:5-methylcytosine-specific restriction protein A
VALNDVTRDGVLAAIEEFDRLGRDAFLTRYGFRTSKAYVLVHEGARYDSKPICGAAHGYSRPDLGALKWPEFSGGAGTVQRQLEDLGFSVLKATPNRASWTEEERILALDLYRRRGMLGNEDLEAQALSEELRRRAFHPDADSRDDFRNINSVTLKLANFAALDPEESRGMPAFSIGDELTWDRYAYDDELRAAAVAAIRAGEPIEVEDPAPPGGAVTRRPIEQQHVREYEVRATTGARAERTEAALVLRFLAWLESGGSSVSSHHYDVTSPPLRNDLCDDTAQRLWEAKGTMARSDVRMAIGQLLDYRRFEDDGWTIGVLLPDEPSEDLARFIASVGAALAYPDGDDTFTILEATRTSAT